MDLEEECQCRVNHWCSADLRVDMLVGHSSTCPEVTKQLILNKTTKLLRELVRGIENWASEEDGVYSGV